MAEAVKNDKSRPPRQQPSWPNPPQEFGYSATERATIVATLPTKDRTRCDPALARLEEAARWFLIDRTRRLQDPPVARREKLTRFLALIEETQRSAIEVGEREIAAVIDERRPQIAMRAAAYARLAKVFYGTDFDREIYYFRVLTVWTTLGGAAEKGYVRRDLERFMLAVTAPVLGARAPKASRGGRPGTITKVVQRYRECSRLGTVAEFKADGMPLVADVDRHIVVNDDPRRKESEK